MYRIIFLLAVSVFATPDLVAPFTVDLLNSKSAYFDTIQVTTYLQNRGNVATPIQSFNWTAVSIGVDSFTIDAHQIYAGNSLNPNNFFEFKDTVQIIKGPFSIHTNADPLQISGEGGGDKVNNVRSQSFNFHPKIIQDTILLIDTLRIHDTVKVAIHDTVKITLRDTVIKRDTIKYCPPTLAKTSGRFLKPLVSTTVFNARGQPEWTGMVLEGEFPQVRLKQGLHLLIQGQQVRRFQVVYK